MAAPLGLATWPHIKIASNDATVGHGVVGIGSIAVVNDVIGRGHRYNLQLNPEGTEVAWAFAAKFGGIGGTRQTFALSAGYYEWWDYWTAFPAADSEEILLLTNGNGFAAPGKNATLRINSDGKIQLHDSDAIASNTPTAIADNALPTSVVLYHQVSFDRTAQTLTVRSYRCDTGALVSTVSGTGLTLGSDVVNNIFHGKCADNNGEGYHCYIDDAFPSDSGFQGIHAKSYCLLPNGNAPPPNDGFAIHGDVEGEKWEMVNETALTGESTSLVSTAVEAYCATFQSCAEAGVKGTIVGVQPMVVFHGYNGAAGQVRYISGATSTDLASNVPGQTPDIHIRGLMLGVDPDTEQPWTVAGVDGLMVGLEHVDTNELHIGWIGKFVVVQEPPAPIGTLGMLGVGR